MKFKKTYNTLFFIVFLYKILLSVAISDSFNDSTNSSIQQTDWFSGSSWRCDHTKEHFAWYCDVEPEKKPHAEPSIPKQTESKNNQSTLTSEDQKALDELNNFKAKVEAKKALAIMEPTPEHIHDYIIIQNALVNKASNFTSLWMKAVWQDADLQLPNSVRPMNSVAMNVYDREESKDKTSILKQLSKDWGIFFVFKSDCRYCHSQSKILNFLSHITDFTIFPISLDGQGTPEYPHPVMDNGMAASLNITEVPAMYLGNIKHHKLIPIGYGVVAIDDLTDRIVELTSEYTKNHRELLPQITGLSK